MKSITDELKTILHFSEKLFHEPSFAGVAQAFQKILKEKLGLSSIKVVKIRRIQNRLEWAVSDAFTSDHAENLELDVSQPLDHYLKNFADSHLFKTKVSVFELGVNCFYLIPLSSVDEDIWHLIVCALPMQGGDDARDYQKVVIEFLASLIQAESHWFGLLDRNQSLIFRDDLTGLFNHRYLAVALDHELRRSDRFKSQFSVLFLDIDGFKNVNDTYGHLVGSKILQQMASVLRGTLREIDYVFRYGGDEFVIILLGASEASSLLAGERLRRKVEMTSFRVDEIETVKVTVSIGIACFPKHALSKDELLRIADNCMYHSKKQGKNRVTIVGDRSGNEHEHNQITT